MAVALATFSLDQAVAQLISLGEKDPLTIARKLEHRHGHEWVAAQLAERWEEILAEIARQRLGSERRGAIVSLSAQAREQGGKLTKRDAVLTSVFIPGAGYIRLGDLTVAQVAEREAYLRRLAHGIDRWASWFAALGGQMVAQGVERVKDLRGPLPELPAGELAS